MLFRLFRPTILWHVSQCVTQLIIEIQRTNIWQLSDRRQTSQWQMKAHLRVQVLRSWCSFIPEAAQFQEQEGQSSRCTATMKWCVPSCIHTARNGKYLVYQQNCIIIRHLTCYHYLLTWHVYNTLSISYDPTRGERVTLVNWRELSTQNKHSVLGTLISSP